MKLGKGWRSNTVDLAYNESKGPGLKLHYNEGFVTDLIFASYPIPIFFCPFVS